MRILRLSGLVVALSLVMTTVGGAKMEYAKKEGKSCTYCHTKAGSKELNDAGKYYKEKGTLKGYQPKEKEKEKEKEKN